MTQPTGITVYHSTDPLRPDLTGQPAAEKLAGFVPFPKKGDTGGGSDHGLTPEQANTAWGRLLGQATPEVKALMAKIAKQITDGAKSAKADAKK